MLDAHPLGRQVAILTVQLQAEIECNGIANEEFLDAVPNLLVFGRNDEINVPSCCPHLSSLFRIASSPFQNEHLWGTI